MEGQYDIPMRFDLDCIPSGTLPAAAGVEVAIWGYKVAVFGVAQGHRRATETPSLMADMYGFKSAEEMSDTKAYLGAHGNYQLEQVSITQLVTL